MALQKEVWKSDIIGNLFKDNSFALRSVKADDYVLGGKVVHMPVAAKGQKGKKNLAEFPQVATNRTDTELTYILDKFYRLPITVEKLEEAELSYEKRQSVVGEETATMIQEAMDSLLVRWSPNEIAGATSPVLYTTGEDTTLDHIDGSAGTRKMMHKSVFKTAATRFSRSNFANAPKVALLTSTHYYEFLESLSEGEKTAVGAVADMKNGVVGRYYGFDIILRSTVTRYRKEGGLYVPVDEMDEDFDTEGDDVQGSLFYADMAVERALGDINVFDDSNNPLYYGDIFSCDMRLGGRIRRKEGVISVLDKFTA